MLKALIVDDEKNCRDSLQILLERYCSESVSVTGQASSIDKAEFWLRSNRPDIIFLDISLPPTNGFELLRSISDPAIQIVFTTAFSEYAIKALRAQALDYLLKPINYKELVNAVAAAEIRLKDIRKNPDAKIPISTESGSVLTFDKDILRLEALGKKCRVILKSNNALISTRSIGHFEELLPDSSFFRVHREYLVRLNEVTEYVDGQNGGWIIMTDGKHVPVAARRRAEFISRLRQAK